MKNIKEVELFLFDMDGTVYIGDREIEGSFDALRELKNLGKRFAFSPTIQAAQQATTLQDCTKWGMKRPKTTFIRQVW